MKILCSFLVICTALEIQVKGAPVPLDNADIAEKYFPRSPLHKFLALTFGEELSRLFDDIRDRIHERKETLLQAHLNGFADLENWVVTRDKDAAAAKTPQEIMLDAK